MSLEKIILQLAVESDGATEVEAIGKLQLDTDAERVSVLEMCLRGVQRLKRRMCKHCRYRCEENRKVGVLDYTEYGCTLTGNRERGLNCCEAFTDDGKVDP
jgi:type II secretory ATPase GspE/PulE/Tfp pilus assembly ATPase PilB-like protein